MGPYGTIQARPGPLKSGKSTGKIHCFYITHSCQKSLSGGQKQRFYRFFFLWFFTFPALQRPGPGPYGPIWTPKIQKIRKKIGFIQPSPKLNSSFLGMPIGPLWAHKGPILGKKLIILIKNHKIINRNIKIVNLEILKVKTWFWNKDLSSLDSIN